MNYQSLFQRILKRVDSSAYFTPVDSVSPEQQLAVAEIGQAMSQPGFDVEALKARIEALHEAGSLDTVTRLSALHVLHCHPSVADYGEAARLVGEQELAALDLGGPSLTSNLASVERHRGVLAYLKGHNEVALEYFTRAFERQRSAENLTNILCTLLRLGEHDEAVSLARQVRSSFPAAMVQSIDHTIATDPDLALLRSEV